MAGMLTRRALLKKLGRAGLAAALFGGACQAESSPATSASTVKRSATTFGTFVVPPPPAGPGSKWVRVDYGIASPYILYKDGGAVLVDAGSTGSAPAILSALQSVGLGWVDLRQVILTHSHSDSVAGLNDVVTNAPDAKVVAGELDIESIPASVDIGVARDGDRIVDLTIVATPGHTPGHISVIDQAAGILVDGDTISVRRGELYGPSAETSEDVDLAFSSLRKLLAFQFETILVGRGEPILSGGHDVVNLIAALSP